MDSLTVVSGLVWAVALMAVQLAVYAWRMK